jgi:glyceraldehyde-3-phosphate dehydrogenase (NADP+)
MKTYPLILAGEEITTETKIEVKNPYNNDLLAFVNYGNKKILEIAIEKADSVFQISSKLPSNKRSEILFSIAAQLKENFDEFALTISLESGKPLIYANGEVLRCIDTFILASEESKRINGEFFSLDAVKSGENRFAITKYFPEGVVAGISPFNFPLNLVAHKIAPALAVGSPIILKPATKTPLSALMLGKLILNTEWPKEAISVIPCSGKDASVLVEDPRIKILSFTGSAEVGWSLKKNCGNKKIILELGGNAGVIVHSDADIDYAIERCVIGSFSYSGQVCISVQRIYVQKNIFEIFSTKFIEKTEKFVIGDPKDIKTTFSSMIDEENAIRVEKWVQEAINVGSKVLVGGLRKNTMYPPTALTNVPSTEKIVCQEVFGPVVVIEPYNTFAEALDLVDNSEFGLQAGVFTHDIRNIMQSYEKINAGGIMINDVPTFRVDQMPYGGNKDSGFGREGIKYSIQEYCHLKLLVINEGYK